MTPLPAKVCFGSGECEKRFSSRGGGEEKIRASAFLCVENGWMYVRPWKKGLDPETGWDVPLWRISFFRKGLLNGLIQRVWL